MQKERVVYFKGLNGIRAIAALSVLISHTFGAIKEVYPAFKFGQYDMADFGVTMFFALSGFLITSLLLLEHQKTGAIDIKGFYMRRILRIWPIYYLYILLTGLCGWLFLHFNIVQPSLVYYLFFAANFPFIFGGGLTGISHMWSIGVEEQFYLFWPWLFRKVKNIQPKIIGVLLFFISLRVVGYLLFKLYDQNLLYRFIHVTRFDCMAIGGLGAILYYQQKGRLIKWLTSIPVQILTILVFLVVASGKFRFWMLIDHQVVALFTVLLILSNISLAKPLLNLENRFNNFFGKISYGLYVYHALLILLAIPLVTWLIPSAIGRGIALAAITLVGTTIIAHLSYQYYEKPFLKLKDRFTTIKSSADPNKV